MKVKRKNNKEFRSLLKTARFKEILESQGKGRVPLLQDITGYSRTYIFAWLASPKSPSFLPMPDQALRTFKLECGFTQPMYPETKP